MASDQGSQGGKAQAIEEKLEGELVESADEYGIDIDEVISRKIDQHEGYNASTVVNFVRSDIRQQIEGEKADTVDGIIMGSRDRHGANWPRRFSLVRSSGDHVEVDSWDGSLPDPDGNEVDIPIGGAKVTFQCEWEADYESYNAKRLDRVEQMDHDELASALGSVAVPPEGLSASDEQEIVAVRGTVSWFEPQSLFDENGQPSEDGPILMTDARGDPQPHFEISLANEAGVSVTGHAERQEYGRPFYAVTDLMKMLTDAYEKYESPSEQAGFVRNGIQGRDVVIVGNVNNFNMNRDGDGEPVTYVHIGVTGIVEIPEDGEESTGVTTRMKEVDSEEPDASGDDEETDGEEAEEEEDDAPAVDEVADQIEQYASLVGEDVVDLTAADIVENAKGIDAPESIIEHALGQLGGAGDEPDSGADGSGDDHTSDVDEEFGDLKESGMFQCPGESCPGKGSSFADLLFHVSDEHVEGGAEEAREWVEDQM